MKKFYRLYRKECKISVERFLMYSLCLRAALLDVRADDFTISISVLVLINNQLADCIDLDFAVIWILDADDVALDGGIDLTVFEREVSTLHSAVFEDESLAIAEWLSADDVAPHKLQVL